LNDKINRKKRTKTIDAKKKSSNIQAWPQKMQLIKKKRRRRVDYQDEKKKQGIINSE
jgi:hypothetical protein